MPTTLFITAEEFVPSTDDRIPSYGIVIRDREVVLVFDEGTPMPCQGKVRAGAEEYFLNRIGVPEDEISAFVSERLHWFVASKQLRRNKFTQKWVWLGED